MKIALLTLVIGVLLLGANTQTLDELQSYLRVPDSHAKFETQKLNGTQEEALSELEAYNTHLQRNRSKTLVNNTEAQTKNMVAQAKNTTANKTSPNTAKNNTSSKILDMIEAYVFGLQTRFRGAAHHQEKNRTQNQNNSSRGFESVEDFRFPVNRKNRTTNDTASKILDMIEDYVFGLQTRFRGAAEHHLRNRTQNQNNSPRAAESVEDFRFPINGKNRTTNSSGNNKKSNGSPFEVEDFIGSNIRLRDFSSNRTSKNSTLKNKTNVNSYEIEDFIGSNLRFRAFPNNRTSKNSTVKNRTNVSNYEIEDFIVDFHPYKRQNKTKPNKTQANQTASMETKFMTF